MRHHADRPSSASIAHEIYIRMMPDKRSWRVLFYLTIVPAIVSVLVLLVKPAEPEHIQFFNDSWVVKQNQVGSTIGDLGGVPVLIPQHFAHFVEYDGDPHFLERKKGPAPKRDFSSRLSSFGFEVRFPDMAPLTAETMADKKASSIETTKWLEVGISSGADFGVSIDVFIQRSIDNLSNNIFYKYKKIATTDFDLTGYAPINVSDEHRGYGVLVDGKVADMNDVNVYFHRRQDGIPDAYIECGNMHHQADRCELRFDLLPTMRTMVSVSFRKGMLPQWGAIKSSVSQIIINFKSPAIQFRSGA